MISRQVIITGLKDLCLMSLLDLWSTEGGACGAQDSNGRSVIDMCLGRKWARAPLWLWPPGDGTMMSQLYHCDTRRYCDGIGLEGVRWV